MNGRRSSGRIPTKQASRAVHALKASDASEGVFEAVVSVFSNVDHGGDRVVRGAFTATLARWASSGRPIPVVWSHSWDDPHAHIGVVLEAAELMPGDSRLPEQLRLLGGLWVKGRVDLDAPVAAQVWRLLVERRVFEWSFAYDVVRERRASDGANELLELDLIEVGPTLKGMNPLTELVSTKSRGGVKAVVSLTGSAEQRQEAIVRAAVEWASDGNVGNGGFFAVHLEATFDDRAVFMVEGWDDPYGEGVYFEAPVTDVAPGVVTLGMPVPAVIEATARRLAARGRHRPAGVKTGRTATGEAQRALLEVELLRLGL